MHCIVDDEVLGSYNVGVKQYLAGMRHGMLGQALLPVPLRQLSRAYAWS